MKKTRILFVAQEMQPYLKVSDIADVARMLPPAMQEKGMEIRALMPRFGSINERRHRLHEVVRLSGINIMINDNDNPLVIKVASLPSAKMQVYFLDNDEYFHRKHAFRGNKDEFFDDNHERCIFFSKGVIETVIKLGWSPDIIHCQGWMTSLIPAYLKKVYKDNPVFKDSKIVYSLHGNQFLESFPKDFVRKAVGEYIQEEDLKTYLGGTHFDLDLGAAEYADALVADNTTHPKLIEMANLAEKPFLMHPDGEIVDTYHDFYKQVLESQSVFI